MVKVYIATKMKYAESLRKRFLEHPEINFTCRWPYVEPFVPPEPQHAANFWEHDLMDVAACDVLVCYGDEEDVLRGALVEVGFALGYGKEVIVVGDSPSFGTWQHLPRVKRIGTMDGVMTYLKTIKDV
tara:strand:+ start:200 stop:583 length:384 start_codon:yes stop_codon:yes gene_type:complete